MTGNDLFESVYRQHYRRMLRYFHQVFRVPTADAEDLIQDSFIRLFKAMGEYEDPAQWPLLETIARHVGYNYVRSMKTIKRGGGVRPESLDDSERAEDPADTRQRHPVDTMIETERLRQMEAAIGDLSNGQRQCLQAWLDDQSSEQIAQSLRLSVLAVKSRIRDAKRALRERLGEELALPED